MTESIGRVPIRRYRPDTLRSTIPILWVHGGAFMKGGLDTPETREVAAALAAEGFQVITLDYHLARFPFVGFPAPLDDVHAVIRSLQAEFPDGVILGGASAGACLVAGAVLRLAAEGSPAPRGFFSAYGLFHATLPPRTPELLGRLRGRRRYMHTAPGYAAMTWHYAGSRRALADPFAFPGGHNLGEFPSALVLDADHDIMRASGTRFADELREQGRHVEHVVVADVDHAFLNRPRDPAFAPTIQRIADWARQVSL